MKQRKYTFVKLNPEIKAMGEQLKALWLKSGKNFWKRIRLELLRSTRSKRIINLAKLEKVCKDNDKIIVPGKVLAGGNLSKALTVVAFSFSASAKQKIEKNNGKCILLSDYIKKNPAVDLRIIG